MQITTQFACCQRPTSSTASPARQGQSSSIINDEFVASSKELAHDVMEGVFWGGVTAHPVLGTFVHFGKAADFTITHSSKTPERIALAGAAMNVAGTAALLGAPFLGSVGVAKAGVALLAGSGLAGMVNHFTT